jgi:hypothetical protein
MKNILLAVLAAGCLIFSGLGCASSAAAIVPAGLPIPGIPDGNYLSMTIEEVQALIGPPWSTDLCAVMLPTADGEKRIMGSGATFIREGGIREENYYIMIRTDLCAVHDVVVAQVTNVQVKTSDLESTTVWGLVDYPLVRQLLLDGPNRDGVEDGEYILKPGELSI